MDKLIIGNFNKERHAHRDWIFGHFMDQDSPFRSEEFEIDTHALTGVVLSSALSAPSERLFSSLHPPMSIGGIRFLGIKWGKHEKGESFEAKEIDPNDQCHTVAILIYGKELLTFSSVGEEVLLESEGDYVFWQPNIPHTAAFREDPLVITIRWPSVLK